MCTCELKKGGERKELKGERGCDRLLLISIPPVTDGKCWFVKLWSSLELFGFEFLSCTNVDSRDKGLIGISKSRVSNLALDSPKKG